MHQNVIGKNVRITNNVRAHIKEKMERIRLNTDNIMDTNIICEFLHGEYTVNATLSFGKKLFHTKEVSDDLYKSIDKVFQKIEREIVKTKSKNESKQSGKHGKEAALTSDNKYNVKTVQAEDKPLTDNDALLIFKSHKNPFLAYLPVKHSADIFSVKVGRYMTLIFKDSDSTIERIYCKNDSSEKLEYTREYIKAISSDGTAAVSKKARYEINDMNVSEAVSYLIENKDENFIIYQSSITDQIEALYRDGNKKFVLIRLFDI